MNKKTIKHFRISLVLFLLVSLFSFQSCKEKDDFIDLLGEFLVILNKTGWLEEKEDVNNIPNDITPFDNGEGVALRDEVSIENKFPPIGDQGSYGTCVTWAAGYNLKTALNAIENNWTNAQLSSSIYQTSPKDLWMAIPSQKKGKNCEGTNFEPALDALIAHGAGTMSEIPYTHLGNCSGDKTGNPKNLLSNYRKIAYTEGNHTEGMTLNNFKGYLNAGRPIVFGARLGDRFMTWNNSAVLGSDTYLNPGMQHAFHAMVLVGYSNQKNAFRVRNSWGSEWGDKGSIWIDYQFFLKHFCFVAFVAQNKSNVTADNGTITSGLHNDTDLMAFFGEDYEDEDYNDPLERKFSYQVYNTGTKVIYPESKWSVVYMLYNATNANDYTILFEDYYTDEKGEGNGELENSSAEAGGWWNNASVQPGKIAGEEEYGVDGFWIFYTMPRITGKYYLVVMADAFDKIAEGNEDNNFYFITAANGKPIEFEKGVMKSPLAKSFKRAAKNKRPQLFENIEEQTLVRQGNLNAYTPQELKAKLIHEKKSGKLDQVLKKHRNSKKANQPIKSKRTAM